MIVEVKKRCFDHSLFPSVASASSSLRRTLSSPSNPPLSGARPLYNPNSKHLKALMANNGEPSSAPQAEKCYELKLGSSFKGNSSSKFSTLRYEFKPASIDKTQPGSLHKNKENRVTVDFNNNQPGKPRVSFEGSCEDYKENDVHAVLFFDGESFRLERLSRAVKRLRHVRLPGESASAANMSSMANLESKSPQMGKLSRTPPLSKQIASSVPVEVERIDVGERERFDMGESERFDMGESERIDIGESEQIDVDGPENPGPKNTYGEIPNLNYDEAEENIEIDIDIDEEEEAPSKMGGNGGHAPYVGVDINIPSHNESDDENVDVDGDGDFVGKEGAGNGAEALNEDSSSSSESSGSGSSGSGSGSSTDSSDDDSASSAGDIDI